MNCKSPIFFLDFLPTFFCDFAPNFVLGVGSVLVSFFFYFYVWIRSSSQVNDLV